MGISGRSDLVEITVSKHAETAKAVLVSHTGEAKDAKWVPKSQIEMDPTDRPGAFVITCPEWLAIEKGWL